MKWPVLLTMFLTACLCLAQTKSAYQQVVALPNGPVTQIVSPHKNWTLVFECPNNCEARILWIEGKPHARRLVKKYERSLEIAWAPDSGRFFINDNFGSNGSESSVIDPITLKITDLGAIVAGHDAQAKQFLRAGHSYIRAKSWLNAHVLTVVLFGHFDEAPPHGVPVGFTGGYRVDLNGKAERVFLHPREEPQ
jgi:hypothetical protein